jgi:hypothetical protein
MKDEKARDPPTTLRQAVPFETCSVWVYDEVRRLSPALGRTRAQFVLAAVLRYICQQRTYGHRRDQP